MLRRLGRRRDERGAVLAMVGIMAMVLVVMAGFAVDLGMQRVGRRDMQALADVVALDLARQLDGRTVTQIQSDPVFATAKEQSIERNDSTLGEHPDVQVELGQVDGTTGQFVELTGSAVPTAVRVISSTVVSFAFAHKEGGATRDSVAATAVMCPVGGCTTGNPPTTPPCTATATGCLPSPNTFACWSVGSFLVKLAATSPTALNQIIGTALNTNATAISYDGLATSEVSFSKLLVELGVGSPSEFATTSITVGRLLDAIATVMTASGSSSADISIVNAIRNSLTTAIQGRVVLLGDLVEIGAGNASALDAKLKVLNLVSGAAFIVNGTNFISVPSLAVTVPGLTNVTTSVKVIESPQQACGKPGDGTKASTSQVTLTVKGSFGGNWSDGIVSAQADNITLTLDLATADAALTTISCLNDVPQSMQLDVTNTSLANLGLTLNLRTLSLLGIPLAQVTASVGATAPSSASGPYTLSLPTNYDTPVQTQSSTISLNAVSAASLNATTLGLSLSLLNKTTLSTQLLNPLITNLNNQLASNLLPKLGINVAGADLWANRETDCSVPSLVEA